MYYQVDKEAKRVSTSSYWMRPPKKFMDTPQVLPVILLNNIFMLFIQGAGSKAMPLSTATLHLIHSRISELTIWYPPYGDFEGQVPKVVNYLL